MTVFKKHAKIKTCSKDFLIVRFRFKTQNDLLNLLLMTKDFWTHFKRPKINLNFF